MAARGVEWVVAGGLAGWAVARATEADRVRLTEAWSVPLLALTPQAAGAAWVSALAMRGKGARSMAVLAGVALTAVVAPRAIPRAQPWADGPVLRVLTANLFKGQAGADAVVNLVRATGADVLCVQELTNGAVSRFKQAGLGDLLPHQLTGPIPEDSSGNGIYARHALTDGVTTDGGRSAELAVPSGQRVRVICVHNPPPKPPWLPEATARWREEMGTLPSPGRLPVIMAGDFNATVDHASFRRLRRKGYEDAACLTGRGLSFTWGPWASRPPALLTIDHVLVDPRCAVLTTARHRVAGSDHLALYAEVRLPG